MSSFLRDDRALRRQSIDNKTSKDILHTLPAETAAKPASYSGSSNWMKVPDIGDWDGMAVEEKTDSSIVGIEVVFMPPVFCRSR